MIVIMMNLKSPCYNKNFDNQDSSLLNLTITLL